MARSPPVAGEQDVDWEAEGLLEGLDDEDAKEARRDLLERLRDDGFELDELKEAADEGRLALLPVERALEGEEKLYTADEIAEKAGADREFLDPLWRALGFALTEDDEKAFGEAELEAVQKVQAIREAGLSQEAIIEISRVMSQGMARLAETISPRFREAFMREGDSELDTALRMAEASRELAPQVGPLLEHVFNLQQRQHTRQAVIRDIDVSQGGLPGAQEVAVGFADLVDFTKLGERLPPGELGAVATRLEELASDVAQSPVRLIKTIGDAAMFVSTEPDALIEAALELVDAAENEGEGFPLMHAGLAWGEALSRGGDWYGRPVNLAARVTDFARPSSVVASNELREASEGDYSWSRAGKRKLKGIDGEVGLNRVRRPDPSDDNSSD